MLFDYYSEIMKANGYPVNGIKILVVNLYEKKSYVPCSYIWDLNIEAIRDGTGSFSPKNQNCLVMITFSI